MAVSAEHIRQTLAGYLAAHPQEEPDLALLPRLLDARAEVTSRAEFRGHVTANAVLVNPVGQVLLIHHVALGRWLTPGGHLEPSDADLAGAALRELAEETGIAPDRVVALAGEPIQVDVHPIPAHAGKGEPAHQHVDFRYLFATSADVGRLQAEEVFAAQWRNVADMTEGALRERVAAALRPGAHRPVEWPPVST